MKKDLVNKFDLEAAFKALNEVEIPTVKGIRPNRENLQEKFTKKLVTDILVEDYFDINDSAELEKAQEEREAEVAKAKLARIEKIVDLDAESEEDLLPSYVGKLIIQCPQCMTLFYKKAEDIEKSEENPEVVNLNEPCQHCGNTSGYTLVGKVDQVGEEEAENYDVEDFEDELNLDFPEGTEEVDPEGTGEGANEETEEVAAEEEEELSLEPIEGEEEEEEEVKESLTEDIEDEIEETEEVSEDEIKEEPVEEILTSVEEVKEIAAEAGEEVAEVVKENPEVEAEEIKEITDEVVDNALEVEEKTEEEVVEDEEIIEAEEDEEVVEESLTEAVDKDLDDKLKAHNEYIEYLKDEIEKAEKSLENAKNDFVKKSIKSRIEALKADLEAALPEALKDEVVADELPTPEESGLEDAAENKEEEPKEETKESLTESLKNEEEVEEALIGDINLNVDARGQSVGIAGGQGGAMGGVDATNSDKLDEFVGPAVASIAAASASNGVSKAIGKAFEDLETEQKLDEVETALAKSKAEDFIVEKAELKESPVVDALNKLEAELSEGKLPREPQVYDHKGNLIKVKDPEVLKIWDKVITQAEADGIDFWNDYKVQKQLIDKACTPDEIEKLKNVEFEDGIIRSAYESLKEAKEEVSDEEFRAMLKNPVFNEGCKKEEELTEEIPSAPTAPFDKAIDAIENAGEDLTPEEQKQEEAELAAKEKVVGESLVESSALLADDGTLATLIYPNRLDPDARREKLLADPTFVKALEVFIKTHNMEAAPEDLEPGVTLVDDMYDCAFEGIKGEDLEDTLDEIISYYIDIKAEEQLTEAAPQGEFVSKLKRSYSSTELMVKELKKHPLFSGFSTRVIQRILLPYYIDNMGRENLSAQSMIDFFTEEGFAPYVLDHFMTMDPLARKELLQADTKFMLIFNAWAREYDSYPSSIDDLEPGETKFGYALDVVFFLDGGKVYRPDLTRRSINIFSKLYANGQFDKAIAEAEYPTPVRPAPVRLAAVEDLNEESFNKLTENYLTEVYSNVKSFEATDCNLNDNKLIIEGIITFKSGRTKTTTFIYEANQSENNKLILEGLNADFATEKAFVLTCNIDTANCLVVESLSYKYNINKTLVEGLLK